jgi:predicted alpha/beta-hydrolase family hydrolase
MRDKHLKDIPSPMLFMQGTRDAFGTPDEIRSVIKRDHLPATLYVIEGGDHSFNVPKSLGVPQPQVYENAMDEIVSWLNR